jgi:hypothetical protein
VGEVGGGHDVDHYLGVLAPGVQAGEFVVGPKPALFTSTSIPAAAVYPATRLA